MKKSPKILLVDSHPTYRRLVKELIRRHYPAIRIQEAFDREDALGKIRRYPPDLIVTEIDLQGRRVPHLPRQMHAIHPDGVIVVLTTCDWPEYREVALQNGARHFISKSQSNGKALMAMIAEALA